MDTLQCRAYIFYEIFESPEDASPKYENSLLPGGSKYEEYKHLLTAHRDSNTYDYVDKSTFSKHWFLRSLEHMDEKAKNFTDFLQLKRLQTLFSGKGSKCISLYLVGIKF